MRSVQRALFTLGLMAAVTAALAAQAFPETGVKAAFLLRFAEYVEWPAAPQGPFVIAVLGRDGMAEHLRTLAGRTLHGRPVEIRAVTSITNARGAHVLYVARGSRSDLRALQRNGPLHGTLVICDEEDGLERGGIINFRTVQGRVRFEVSLQGARQANLKVSADLLSVALRVIQ
ncbi:MAG: YfiR family protein [Pseudomonadota bacterium]|nr:YfiR family protein [Pseudomonadota bacterium]